MITLNNTKSIPLSLDKCSLKTGWYKVVEAPMCHIAYIGTIIYVPPVDFQYMIAFVEGEDILQMWINTGGYGVIPLNNDDIQIEIRTKE